jgi:NO-binding membrane sensor protein with MHYT domain
MALWMVACMTGLLGAWAYVEYVRRVRHDGPVLARRELLFATLALGSSLWGAMVVSLSAQGLPFDLGFHPTRLAASLALPLLVVFALSYAAVAVPRLWMHALLALLFGAGMLATDWAVIWSVAPAPGLVWRREPLGAAGLIVGLGFGVSLRMVIMQRRGSPADSRGRRFGAALLLAAALAAGLELVAVASDLHLQAAAQHSRELPEMAVALAAGGAVPLLLMLMLVDQRMQARIRAANRHRRISRKRGASKSVASRRPSTRSVETPGT